MSMGNNMLPDPTAPGYKPTTNWGEFFSHYKSYCLKNGGCPEGEVDKVLKDFFSYPKPKNELFDRFLESLK
jgi:hypothetical protein